MSDLGEFLRGRWEIDRDVVDEHTGVTGAFHGTAVFSPTSFDVFDWVETGELQWSGRKQQAGRRLLVAVQPAACATADIAFDDGLFFHRVDLSSGADTFVHGCAPDTYSGSWTVDAADHFTVRWTVEGPAKRITIGSSYRRA
ncbi:MAG TPA: DUF6314 family protein [Acidothermaceae bacterium]|nr:DUF6314 family protein [Acidothermaceae bacterium]